MNASDPQAGLVTVAHRSLFARLRALLRSRRGVIVLSRYMAVSLTSAGIDYVVFMLVFFLTGRILLSTYAARFVTLFINYGLNARLVFRTDRGFWNTLPRYALLVLASGMFSSLLITLLVRAFNGHIYLAKPLAELMLALFNYSIQKRLIFKNRASPLR